jgi:CheY-like chemotaxis protein
MSEQSIETVLLVEDNLGDARLLREMFNEHAAQNAELTLVASMSEAEKHLSEHSVDLILLDLGLPDAQGLEAIRRARAAAPRAPLVMLTGRDDALAAQALQEGAQDYLVKGQIDTRGLLRTLRYAIERKRLERLKDEFIATVSHELRTPLTSISASLGLLMGKTAGNLPDPASGCLRSRIRTARDSFVSSTIFSISRKWTPGKSSSISVASRCSRCSNRRWRPIAVLP